MARQHTARRGPGQKQSTAVDSVDPITARAIARVREAPPHERLLALADCTLSEFAKRMTPQVSRSRLRDVFALAEARGRLTLDWAERLGRAVDAPPEAILDLFSIDVPSVRGRPRARRSA
jgi:plasmid maintenance system antidote protein VapI